MNNEFVASCPQGVFQNVIEIKPEYVDANGTVTPGALARLMQDMTEGHMDEAGIGYFTLREKGILWFIVWSSVWITKLPKQGDVCVVRTWPGEMKLGMYSRRYGFYTEAGEELLVASSLFMMIDEETRKMVAPYELPSELAVVDVKGQPDLPRQRNKFPELPLCHDHLVKDSEIDKNGHVNNAFYLDWTNDLLNPAYVAKHPLKFFWIQYSKELMAGQTVNIQHSVQGNEFFVKGIADGEPSFQVKMDFAE